MKLSKLKSREVAIGFGFVSPALILLIIFGLLPIVIATVISLFKVPLVNLSQREFIGLDNYIKAFQDSSLIKSFINTIYYTLWYVPIQTLFALILALLIQKPLRGVAFFRSGYYIPVVISTVVASVIWQIMLDSQSGLINSILNWVGIPQQPFLMSATQALPTLAVMMSWKWAGLSMIIFLAGLNNIPDELYEAGVIDGANSIQLFLHITVPQLKRQFVYVVVTNTVYAFKIFTPVYIITQGGPQESTLVIVYYIFREAFRYNRLGYSSAIAVLLTLLLIALSAIQLKAMKTDEN